MNLMPKLTTLLLTLFLLTGTTTVFAQSNEQKAQEEGKQAITLEDQGKFDDAIKLLEDAQKLDPNSLTYPYELAYSYYSKGDYKKAVSYLEPLTTHPQTINRVFQLLGNSYDILGESDKALATYAEGLKRFPASGNLYLEQGNVYWNKKDYGKALGFYEQGIKADPAFPSNYYRASRIYCASDEAIWGMFYGEIFMNLERNTKRTSEISKLLLETYKKRITFKGHDTIDVNFTKHTIMVNPKKMTDIKDMIPFNIVYDMGISKAVAGHRSITLGSVDSIRTVFLNNYFKEGENKIYPNALLDYQRKVQDAGFLEEYNHWVLSDGDQAEFNRWQLANQSGWNNFIKWFKSNSLVLDNEHHFYRGQ